MEILWFLAFSLIGGLTGVIVFCVYMKRGQFDDPEDPKYEMFRQEEEENAEIQK